MDVLIVFGFLAFIAWRERQHAAEVRAVAARRGGGTVPVRRPLPRLGRPEREKPKVISADDDAAFNEAHGVAPAEAEEGDES